jgi:hypothetical protein
MEHIWLEAFQRLNSLVNVFKFGLIYIYDIYK